MEGTSGTTRSKSSDPQSSPPLYLIVLLFMNWLNSYPQPNGFLYGRPMASAWCHLYGLWPKFERHFPLTSNREAPGRNSGPALVACLFLYHLGASGREGSDCHVPSQMKGEEKLHGRVRESAITVTILLCSIVTPERQEPPFFIEFLE